MTTHNIDDNSPKNLHYSENDLEQFPLVEESKLERAFLQPNLNYSSKPAASNPFVDHITQQLLSKKTTLICEHFKYPEVDFQLLEYLYLQLRKVPCTTLEIIGDKDEDGNYSGGIVNNNALITIMKFVAENPSINTLKFDNLLLDDSAIEIIVNTLMVSKSIKELNLTENDFSAKGFQYLSTLVQGNYNLQNLILDYNSLTPSAVNLLAEMVNKSTTLCKLSLKSCLYYIIENDPSNTEVCGFLATLANCSQLHTIDLTGNNLSDNHLGIFCETYKNARTSLATLILDGNQLALTSIINLYNICIEKIRKISPAMTTISTASMNDIDTLNSEQIQRFLTLKFELKNYANQCKKFIGNWRKFDSTRAEYLSIQKQLEIPININYSDSSVLNELPNYPSLCRLIKDERIKEMKPILNEKQFGFLLFSQKRFTDVEVLIHKSDLLMS